MIKPSRVAEACAKRGFEADAAAVSAIAAALPDDYNTPLLGLARTGRDGAGGLIATTRVEALLWDGLTRTVLKVDLREYSKVTVEGGCLTATGDGQFPLEIFAGDEQSVAGWVDHLGWFGIEAVRDQEEAGVLTCVVVGGVGFGLKPGETVQFRFARDAIRLLRPDQPPVVTTYEDVVEFDLGGPGAVTTGGGFIGGGFGVQGAITGIAVASVLNSLTKKTKIFTTIHLATADAELFLFYDKLEPGALRIALSSVFVQLRQANPDQLIGRLERIDALRERAVLSESEFRLLKAKIIGDSQASATWPGHA